MKEMLPDMRPYGMLLVVSVSKMKEMLPGQVTFPSSLIH
jgi:hypothetical protein